jgi:ClpX C4-type zinc finger
MTATDLLADQACSFCLKLPAEVERMVAGAGVFICNECVDLCVQIIAGMPRDSSAPGVEAWEQRLSDDDLLAHLPKVAAAGAQVERHLTAWVRKARDRGITWTRIGEALGMTRQSAWERFSGED